MKGMMMHRPLKIADLITFAADTYPAGEIVSVRTEGDIHRTTYKETAGRIARLAHGLKALGIAESDRVATLAWNGYRHFELYYGVSGIGAVCHTINPRLFHDQIEYIINHAKDRVMFLDTTWVEMMEGMQDKCPTIEKFIILCDSGKMPETALRNAVCFEEQALCDGT